MTNPFLAIAAALMVVFGLAAFIGYLAPDIARYRTTACKFERLRDGDLVVELEFLNPRECSKRGGYPL